MVDKNNSDVTPFDPNERARIRKMMEDFERCKWLYALGAQVAAWVVGVIAAIYYTQDVIAKTLKLLKAWLAGP